MGLAVLAVTGIDNDIIMLLLKLWWNTYTNVNYLYMQQVYKSENNEENNL